MHHRARTVSTQLYVGWHPVTTERPEPPLIADEREMLRAFLDFHRATLAMKCDGLSDDDLRRRSMPPSTLTLLGLVRHMAEVERTWFRRVINGEDVPLVWSAVGDFQEAYDASGSTRAEAFAAWEAEVEPARARSKPRRRRWTSSDTTPDGMRTCRCGWSCCT